MRWFAKFSRNSRSLRSALIVAPAMILLAPGAVSAQGTLFVEGDKVGIGIATPAFPLHVVRTTAGETRLLQIDNAGPARATFKNTTAPGVWSFGHENNDHFSINRGGTGIQEFSIAPNGNILVSGSVVHSSSRETKRDFEALDPRSVLSKVAGIVIAEWRYSDEPQDVRHIGPTAEDFHAAFGLGTDNKHIAINDSAGVALVAIQGLHQLVEEKDGEVAELRARLETRELEVSRLAERLDALESQLKGSQ